MNPLLAYYRTKRRRSKYPHVGLAIGADVIHQCRRLESCSKTVYAYGRKHGLKFTVKILDNGVYIRRVA